MFGEQSNPLRTESLSPQEWRLFCYVSGESSTAECAAIEAELQSELARGETALADTLARMSQLILVTGVAAESLSVPSSEAVGQKSRHVPARQSRLARAVLAAGVGVVGIGAWWLASLMGQRIEPLSGEQRALVAAWMASEASGPSAVADLREGDLTGLVVEATDDESASELVVPSWLEAAIAAEG